jgi:hypothetical protein
MEELSPHIRDRYETHTSQRRGTKMKAVRFVPWIKRNRSHRVSTQRDEQDATETCSFQGSSRMRSGMNAHLEPPKFQQGAEHAARHDRTNNALMRSQDADETQIQTNAVGVRNIGEITTRHFEAAELLDLSLRLTAGTPGTGGGGVTALLPTWDELAVEELAKFETITILITRTGSLWRGTSV